MIELVTHSLTTASRHVTVAIPENAQDGDFVFVVHGHYRTTNQYTIGPAPDGWTHVTGSPYQTAGTGPDMQVHYLYLVVDGNSGQEYTFLRSGTSTTWPAAVAMHLFRGVDPVSPINGQSIHGSTGNDNSGPGNLAIDEIITTVDGCFLVVTEFQGSHDDGVSGFTEIYNTDVSPGSTALVVSAWTAEQEGAGSAGAVAIDADSHLNRAWAMFAFAPEITLVPEVVNYDPAPGTAISPNTTLSFDIINGPFLAVVYASFPHGSRELCEVIHDGYTFRGNYQDSPNARTSLGDDEYHYVVQRRGGWPARPTLGFFLKAAPTPEGTAPAITSFDPARESTVLTYQPITWDVTDDGAFGAFIFATFGSGEDEICEVVFDGDRYRGNFTNSHLSDISGGQSHTVSRHGGWLSAPTLEYAVFDEDGNSGVIS